MDDIENSKYVLRPRIYYGIGAVAFGVKSNGLNYLLLYFYSQVLGLPAEWVSFGIFIALMLDAVSDPLIGYISDNFRSKWGRRHPFMYLFGVPAAIAYYFLWTPPDLSSEQLFIYFISLTILARTLMTLYEIPSVALGPELTFDYDERTKFAAARYFFGWWGGLSMALLIYFVFLPEESGGMENVAGWSNYGFAASIIIAVSIYICAIGLHSHIPKLTLANVKKLSLFEAAQEIRQALSNRQFLALFTSASFFSMAAGISLSLSIYYARHFWELRTEQLGYLQLPLFASALVALIIAPVISERLGKKWAAIATVLFWVTIAPLPLFLRLAGLFPENSSEMLLPILMFFAFVETTLAIMSGIFFAAMFADIVEDNQVITKQRSEGLYYSASSFTQKALNSLGVLAAGQMLAYVDFPEGAKPGDVPAETMNNLAFITIGTLGIILVAAISALFFYNISRTSHNSNLENLKAEHSIIAGSRNK